MSIPSRFTALADAKSARANNQAIVGFLVEAWSYLPDTATTFLAFRDGHRWVEHAIRRDRRRIVLEFIEEHPSEIGDLYFCPNGFRGPLRRSQFALDTCLAWSDIDESDPENFKPRPNILWETSAGRYQGIWIWDDILEPHAAEQISKGLLRYGGDKGGWSITKYLRVPGTINNKPERNRDQVRLLRFNRRPQPVPNFPISSGIDFADITGALDPSRFESADVIKRYRRKVSLFARSLMEAKRIIYPDRSVAIYVITSELIRAGSENDEIACVLLDNPHFVEKHGANLVITEREILTIRAKLGVEQ